MTPTLTSDPVQVSAPVPVATSFSEPVSTSAEISAPTPTDFELEPTAITNREVTKTSTKLPTFAPGDVVWLEPGHNRSLSEFYGLLSRPVVVMKNISPRYLVVLPLLTAPHRSSMFPPLTLDGRAYYAALPKFRIIPLAHLLTARPVSALKPYVFNTLVAKLNIFLTP